MSHDYHGIQNHWQFDYFLQENIKTILIGPLWRESTGKSVSTTWHHASTEITDNVHNHSLGWERVSSWWYHQMETFSVLLAFCAGNSLVPSEFPAQGPVMQSFDAFFDLHLNKQLNKQSWGSWSETPSCSLWCHCNVTSTYHMPYIICHVPVIWSNPEDMDKLHHIFVHFSP